MTLPEPHLLGGKKRPLIYYAYGKQNNVSSLEFLVNKNNIQNDIQCYSIHDLWQSQGEVKQQ